jgi:hypothetical protein
MQPSAQPPKSEATLKLVGSNTFGRNAKMSSEQTFNMMVSDGWLCQMPGYKKVIDLIGSGNGRALYSSAQGGFMIAVADNRVFRISGPPDALNTQFLFEIDTFFGDISIDENVGYQIAICDGLDLWIYDWRSNTSNKAILPIDSQTGFTILPGYVTYHDGYFIVPNSNSSFWYLSSLNNGLVWDWGAGATYVAGRILTKPTNAVAVLRAPGKGNLIYVFGKTVTELWQNVGAQLFPYQRNSSASIDYGCVSSTTIAAMDNYVAFLGANEKSGPVIMVSEGSGFTHLSTDGIDFKLADLVNPALSYAFFYRIDGHVFYQITFYDPRDNYTLVYDFNTKMFFYATDENMNFHIAEAVAYYNNTYYFVSLIDASIYEMSGEFTTYDYTSPSSPGFLNEFEPPRMRICNSIEQADTSRFIANSLAFQVEQGVDERFQGSQLSYLTTEGGLVISQESDVGYIGQFLQNELVVNPYVPRIDMSISKDSGQTFGNTVQKFLNPLGNRSNRVIFYRLGAVNDLAIQFRFWGLGRFTVGNGVFQARVLEGAR